MIDCFTFPDETAEIKISQFKGENKADEYNIFIRPRRYSDTACQLSQISQSYAKVLSHLGVSFDTSVFRRFFCSDLTNQAAVLEGCPLSSSKANCAVSHVCQPPMPPAKVSMWAYHIADVNGLDKHSEEDYLKLQRKNQSHHWMTNVSAFLDYSLIFHKS